jgi:hypothetical protein
MNSYVERQFDASLDLLVDQVLKTSRPDRIEEMLPRLDELPLAVFLLSFSS